MFVILTGVAGGRVAVGIGGLLEADAAAAFFCFSISFFFFSSWYFLIQILHSFLPSSSCKKTFRLNIDIFCMNERF